MEWARRREAAVFFLPKVMTFSARRAVSFAFANVVVMASCVKREVSWWRRSWERAAEVRERWRYLEWPPAIFGGGVGVDGAVDGVAALTLPVVHSMCLGDDWYGMDD